MSHAGRRKWRLFSLALLFGFAANSAHAQTVTLTTVNDIVYRADGNPASGTLLISWPAFVTADGHAVAAGNKA
jgi:trimeric autotransporter adhesin